MTVRPDLPASITSVSSASGPTAPQETLAISRLWTRLWKGLLCIYKLFDTYVHTTDHRIRLTDLVAHSKDGRSSSSFGIQTIQAARCVQMRTRQIYDSPRRPCTTECCDDCDVMMFLTIVKNPIVCDKLFSSPVHEYQIPRECTDRLKFIAESELVNNPHP